MAIPSPSLVRRWEWGVLAGLGAILVLVALQQEAAVHRGVLVDDAYITLRHARNLVDGHGAVYNPGERVEGYTSFLHVLLAGLGFVLGAEPVAWLKGLGIAAALALLPIGFLLWRPRFGPGVALGLCAALALDPRLGAMATWGLETLPYLAIGAAALLAFDRARFQVCGVLFALQAMTRLEAVLQVAAATVVLALVAARHEGTLSARIRSGVRACAPMLAAFSTLFLPWYLGRWLYYGWPFPNTFYAKVGDPRDAWGRGIEYLLGSIRDMGLHWACVAALIAAAILGVRAFRPRGPRGPADAPTPTLAVMALGLLLHLFYVASVGGDFFNERLLYHALPQLLSVIAAPIQALLPNALATAFALGLALSLARSPHAIGNGNGVSGWASLGQAMRAFVPPDSVLATGAAGALPFYAGLRTIDALGLCDAHIAHRDLAIGSGMPGHEKSDPDYVLSRDPDYVGAWLDAEGRAEAEYPSGLPDHRLAAIVDMSSDFVSITRVVPVPEDAGYHDVLHALGSPPGRFGYGLFERRPTATWSLAPDGDPSAGASFVTAEVRLPHGRYRARLALALDDVPADVAEPCAVTIASDSDTVVRDPIPQLEAARGALERWTWFDVRGGVGAIPHRVVVECVEGVRIELERASIERMR